MSKGPRNPYITRGWPQNTLLIPKPMRPQEVNCRSITLLGEPCKKIAYPGSDYCIKHGGRRHMFIGESLGKVYKTGRYQRMLSPRLAELYQRAFNDPNLLSLREDLSLLDVHIQETIERIGKVDADWLKALLDEMALACKVAEAVESYSPDDEDLDCSKEALAKLKPLSAAERRAERRRLALYVSSVRQLQAHTSRIATLIASGADEMTAWSDLTGQLEQRRRTVETEGKRQQQLKQILTAEQAMSIVTALMMAVTIYVKDKDTLNSVSDEFVRITGWHDPENGDFVVPKNAQTLNPPRPPRPPKAQVPAISDAEGEG